MARQDLDDRDGEDATPWYNRTPNMIGASVVGLGVIAIVIAGVTFVSHQFSEPQQAPLNFVEPSFSATANRTTTSTTTATITSTSPPVTTDINPSSTSPTSSSDTPSSPTSDTPTRTAWTQPYTPPGGSEPPSTTRRGPRTNVTRTLYPQP